MNAPAYAGDISRIASLEAAERRRRRDAGRRPHAGRMELRRRTRPEQCRQAPTAASLGVLPLDGTERAVRRAVGEGRSRSRGAAAVHLPVGRKVTRGGDLHDGARLHTVYNVASGFEGDLDQGRHRGTVSGWKVEGLPGSRAVSGFARAPGRGRRSRLADPQGRSTSGRCSRGCRAPLAAPA